MRCYLVPALALALSGCASLAQTPSASEQPTTFVVGDKTTPIDAERKTTDLPGMDMMEETPRFLPLRWFFGGH